MTALVLSVCIHLVAAFLIIFSPRFMPRDDKPHEQGAVELLMVEQKGAQPSQAAPPNDSKAANAQPEKVEPPKTAPPPPAKAAPAPLTSEHGEPLATSQTPPSLSKPSPPQPSPPQPAEATSQPVAKEQNTQPAPPPAQKAPVFDLAGSGSESNAIVLGGGGHILPAMPDDRFRNRPPIYPEEAAALGQHGAVVVMIHVAANGFASGADVVQSSGTEKLDQAAINAVLKWHFHPAMRNGQTIPFDMQFRFVFQSY